MPQVVDVFMYQWVVKNHVFVMQLIHYPHANLEFFPRRDGVCSGFPDLWQIEIAGRIRTVALRDCEYGRCRQQYGKRYVTAMADEDMQWDRMPPAGIGL